MKRAPTLTLPDDSEITLPTKWAICSACEGHGKSSAYLGAYTSDEMDEAGPEFERAYFNGAYDKTCDACDGHGKVQVVDTKRVNKKHLAMWREQRRIDRELDAEEAMERRMGA